MRFGWHTAWKIAWRESRASSVKFLFVIVAVAIGVGSLTGVRGFSRAFHGLLLSQARTLMAADLSLRVFTLPDPDQQAALEDLSRRGVQRTWITETLSMASAAPGHPPMLVSIKAVDPTVYPFYGEIRLDPPGPLSQKLTADTVAVSDDVLLRLQLKPGDTIRLGGHPFNIVGRVAYEPDRMLGSLNVGPRVMITRGGLEKTGLMLPGSRAAERYLFRLGPRTPGIQQARDTLKKAFPEALIADYRETHPIITQGLDRATTFLSLVSLITLIIGALGVATAMHAHLQQKMDSIAIMKCIGARSNQIIRIYVLQTLALGTLGGLLGVLIGLAVQRAFPVFLARFFQLQPSVTWDFITAAQGMSVGLLATLLFTLPPLLTVRRIKPGAIFRREMEETKPGWRTRLSQSKESLIAGALIIFGIGGIAASLTSGKRPDAFQTGAYFTGSLIVSLLVLSAIAWLLLGGLRKLSRSPVWKLPMSLRHGIANLYRPGNHAQAALVALGIGVMFTLTVYLVQHGLLKEIRRSAPPGMPNVFLIDVSPEQKQGVLDLIAHQPGISAPPEFIGTVAAKMLAYDGKQIDKLPLKGWARRFHYTRTVTSAGVKPEYVDIVQGNWWNPADRHLAPQVAVSDEVAHTLKVQPGSTTEWQIAGRKVTARVACIQKIDSIHLASRVEFIFSPGALDSFPGIYYGSLRVAPGAVSGLQQALYQGYPTVTVMNMADVLQTFQGVVDQIAIVIRFISLFAILAGTIILASSIAGTRFRRVREVVILKTLGATRWRVSKIFSVEFLVLGAVAGVMGSLLANGFASLLLKRMLNAHVSFEIWPSIACVGITALIANFAGWMASFRILGQKPLQILREE
ncbi:MAG: ABC transporter permease [Bryobacteraceae bacterium]